jgi:hypothetical protein
MLFFVTWSGIARTRLSGFSHVFDLGDFDLPVAVDVLHPFQKLWQRLQH